MKNTILLSVALPLAALAAEDLTSSLEYIANPAYSTSWNGRSNAKNREVMCITPYRDKLYLGIGNTEANPGPCPIIALDPITGEFETELYAGTEAFDYFKILSDGRLWAGAVDPHENDANYGHYFVRDTDGTWSRYSNLPTIHSKCPMPTHIWDMTEWNGEVYFAGYGVASVAPSNLTAKAQARVTTSGYSYQQYYQGAYGTWWDYHRLQGFLAFTNTLFAVPNNYYKGTYPDICQATMYRMDKGDTYMHCITNSIESIYPGMTNNDTNDFELSTYYRYSNCYVYATIWHPHPYKDRVLYVVSDWGQDSDCGQVYVPLFGASAYMTSSNTIASTRIEIDERFHPIDFYEHDGTMYMLAYRYNTASRDMTHGVWSTDDGVTFSKLFTFDFQQVMSSLAYYNGNFYFGSASQNMSMPANAVTYATTTDTAGRIYRIPYTLEPVQIVPSQTSVLSLTEGTSASVSFSLSAKPSSNIVCAVELRDANGMTVSPSSLTFTTSNWSTPHTVTVTYPYDHDSTAHDNAILCRGGSAATSAGIAVAGVETGYPYTIEGAETFAPGAGTSVTFAATVYAPFANDATATLSFDGVAKKTWNASLAEGSNEFLVEVETTPDSEIAWTFTVDGVADAISTNGTVSTEQYSAWFPASYSDIPPSTNLLGGSVSYTPATSLDSASNVVVEATVELFSTPSLPAVSSDAKSCIAMLRGEGGTNSFVALTADGWVALSNESVDPVSGATYAFKAEFCAPTGGVRSVRYSLNGYALSSGDVEWLPAYSSGTLGSIEVSGLGEISAMKGLYAASLDGAPHEEEWTYEWEVPFYHKVLNVTNLHAMGIMGQGVRVGVVDSGIAPVVVDGVTNLSFKAYGGSRHSGTHGLTAASIIGSRRFGIAPKCELFVYDTDGSATANSASETIKGLWWCATNGCQVINMSFAFATNYADQYGYHESFNAEIQKIADQTGVIMILGGGNNYMSELNYVPQDTTWPITIGGVKTDLTPAKLTNSWRKDFCAFGDGVPAYTSESGTVENVGGTSFATPMATGIVALMLQQANAQGKTLTRDEVYFILKSTARSLAEGRTKEYGWGLVQAAVLPDDYLTQAEIDADRAANYVEITGFSFNDTRITQDADDPKKWHITLNPGDALTLQPIATPSNATEPVRWYCGNYNFNFIGADQVLAAPSAIPSQTFYGTTLTFTNITYYAINDSMQEIGTLSLHLTTGEKPAVNIVRPVIGANDVGSAISLGKTVNGNSGFGVCLETSQTGAYYTAYVSESLAGPFKAEAILPGTGLGIELLMETRDRPSLFVIVSATETAPALGAELE